MTDEGRLVAPPTTARSVDGKQVIERRPGKSISVGDEAVCVEYRAAYTITHFELDEECDNSATVGLRLLGPWDGSPYEHRIVNRDGLFTIE